MEAGIACKNNCLWGDEMNIVIPIKNCAERPRINSLIEEISYIIREYPDVVKDKAVVKL